MNISSRGLSVDASLVVFAVLCTFPIVEKSTLNNKNITFVRGGVLYYLDERILI